MEFMKDKSTGRSIYAVELDSPNATTGTFTLDKSNYKTLRVHTISHHTSQIRPAIIEDNRYENQDNFGIEIVKPVK